MIYRRLCLEIITQYNSFGSDSNQRNVSAWRPVVVVILTAFSKFNDTHFELHVQKFYPSAIKLLLQDMGPDVRVAVYNILFRAGKIFNYIASEEKVEAAAITELIPTAPIPTTDTI